MNSDAIKDIAKQYYVFYFFTGFKSDIEMKHTLL